MAKIMVLQHVPFEPLGTLDPLIRSHRHRVRYVNFSRDMDARPSIKDYDALIVLGGPMSVNDVKEYPFLLTEIDLIKAALDRDIPVLGICLGSQLLAKALGADVYQAPAKEIGWYKLQPTAHGQQDKLIQHFKSEEAIFQWHGDTFDLPVNTTHLIQGNHCQNQAFRVGDKAYGLQFHLEINLALVERWVHLPLYQGDLNHLEKDKHVKNILQDTKINLPRSSELSTAVFTEFLNLLKPIQRHVRLPSR